MDELGLEEASSPSASASEEVDTEHEDNAGHGKESEEDNEDNGKDDAQDSTSSSSSSDSEGSAEDGSERSAKSGSDDGGNQEAVPATLQYDQDSTGYTADGECYPLADLPLEVITTVEPTNYAYPVLKNMSNGVLTHRNIFTEFERSVLVNIINKYRNIVDTRSRTREIYLEKQNVWQQIVEEYNSTDNIMVRTEKELRKCWDNMKYRAKQAEKEMVKVEVKAEELEPDIKAEPLDHDALHFATDFDGVGEEGSWPCGEPAAEEEREPALKKARQESPKLSSLLLAAAHKRSPSKKLKSGGTTPKNTGSSGGGGGGFPYSIPACTKVMHVKKKSQANASNAIGNASVSEIPILPKGLASCLSITNIPNPVTVSGHLSGSLGSHSRDSVSPNSSPLQASMKPMPSLKKMVPSKHQSSALAKSSSLRNSRKSNGLSSKARNHSAAPQLNPGHCADTLHGSSVAPSSPTPEENEGDRAEAERLLAARLVSQRLELEQREHELRMRMLEKELQAHTYQSQYWSLKLKLLRSGREGLNLAGATNGDIN